MPEEPEGERLAERRYVTVLLRLVLESNGTLVHGEVADLDGRSRGKFAEWAELGRAVQESLKRW